MKLISYTDACRRLGVQRERNQRSHLDTLGLTVKGSYKGGKGDILMVDEEDVTKIIELRKAAMKKLTAPEGDSALRRTLDRLADRQTETNALLTEISTYLRALIDTVNAKAPKPSGPQPETTG